jgi:hypothetical protein
MLYAIFLIILGVLAAPSLLLSKKPDAQEVLNKIAPYQGYIGVVACLWGIWGVVSALMNISFLTTFPIWWITWIATGAVTALLGFILGYGLIAGFMASNQAAKEKAAELLAKLAPIQGKLGLAAIGLGVWALVAFLVFFKP